MSRAVAMVLPRSVCTPRVRLLAAACLLAWPAVTLAQGAAPAAAAGAPARASGLAATLDTTLFHVETYRPDSGTSLSELTTEVRPGLQYSSRSGRLQGNATGSVGLLYRSRTDPDFEARSYLSAALTGRLIDDALFVDIAANIGRQSLSAFGQQSLPGQQIDNRNSQETGSLSISPVLRGRVAGVATYDLRLTAEGRNTRKSIVGDATSTGASLALASANVGAVVGWGLNYETRETDFRATGDSTTERAVATLNIQPDVDWRFSLRGGRERNDLQSRTSESSDTWGVTARWSPSPRTLVDASTDRRFFGRAHALSLSYRLPLSTLRFSSFRDVNLTGSSNGRAQPGTLFDLFFEQFASQEPDPVRRRELVNTFLAGLGLDPNAVAAGGFVNDGPTVQERHDLAWAYTLQRLTLSVQGSSTSSRRLAGGNLAGSGAQPLTRQRSYTGSAAYRLTPTATATLIGSRLMTKSVAGQPGTDLKSLSLALSERLGRFATVSLNARYTVFGSSLNPYRESAAGVSLALRY